MDGMIASAHGVGAQAKIDVMINVCTLVLNDWFSTTTFLDPLFTATCAILRPIILDMTLSQLSGATSVGMQVCATGLARTI